jgi:hypothetical protein
MICSSPAEMGEGGEGDYCYVGARRESVLYPPRLCP